MPPSTQQSRPFFSNFLAAFRSSQLSSTPILSNSSTSSHQKAAHTHAHTHSHSHSQPTPSQPRQISTSTSTNSKSTATSNALRGIDRSRGTNSGVNSTPMGSCDSSPSPGASSYLNQYQNQSSNPNSNPNTTSAAQYSNANSNIYNSGGPQRFKSTADRRGSDSSSEGFRDVLGREKWYIGGRTQTGEERYFQLGVIRRRRSGGEMSLDRLSL